MDLPAATGAGNTVAAMEHTVALMLALTRNIPDANQSVKGASGGAAPS